MTRPPDPAGGSRLPWKSLNDSSWIGIVAPFLAARDVPLAKASPVAAMAATATTLVRRLVRGEVMWGPCQEEDRGVARCVHANGRPTRTEDAWCNALRAFTSHPPRGRPDRRGT